MVERQKDPCRVTLKDVRLSYPQLFKAKAFGKGKDGEPAFSASFLIDKESKTGQANIDAVEDAIYEAKLAKWVSKDKFPKLKDDKVCFHDGDDDEDAAEEKAGMMVLSARNYKKPRVLDRDKEDVVEADGIVYGGCYVDAIVRIWAQDNDWGKRINCSLEGVRFRRDGKAFGAAPFDPDEFEDLGGDDGDRPSRSRRSRDDDDERPSRRDRDEDERPSRSSRGKDDDDAPRSRRGEDDERPSRRSRDDGDERPARRGRDDDERPSRSSRDRDDDDAPRSRRSREDDDDAPRSMRGRDDEERPARRGRDEDDERPRRSREDDDAPRSRRSRDNDERPARRGRNDDVV